MARAANSSPPRADPEPAYLRLTADGEHALRLEVAAEAFPAATSPRQLTARLGPGEHQTAQLGPFAVAVNGGEVRVEHPQLTRGRQFSWDDRARGLSFDCGAAPLYGLGEGGPQGDRRGHLHPMTNGMEAFEMEAFGARVPIPFIVSPEGWALWVAGSHGPIDLRGPRGAIHSAAAAARIDLHLLVAKDPLELYSEFAALTGLPSLPPIWALGYQQSHRSLEPGEALAVAHEFRRRRLPCDVLIFLGTGYCPSGWNRGHGSFEFNEQVFPEELIAALHALNFRVVLHVTQAPADLDRVAAAYWEKHRPLLAAGADGFWADDGDELPPAARLARHRMYYERPLADRPDVRPYALHRNAVAEARQFGGGWLWSGDIYSRWESLRNSVRVGINTSASGCFYWGTDTGGFWPTTELTGELYARWFQFSAFTPLFRGHGRTWHTRLPWGWNTGALGPAETDTRRPGVAAPAVADLHDAAIEPACRRYLELRSRLMPYSYSLAYAASTQGLPLIRGLWMHYPDDPRAVAEMDQFLWGRELLVAPVTEPGATTRDCYLPPGLWHDYWTAARHEGGRVIRRPVDLATMPLFVRAGAIIPLGPVRQFATEISAAPLEWHVYPGADGEFRFYHDDGVGLPPDPATRFVLQLTWADADRRLTIRPLEGEWSSDRFPFTVTVHDESGDPRPHRVVVEDR